MPDWEQAAWPRAEHLQRVFHVRSGDQRGTAFVIDVEGRQYLVSALHVVAESVRTATLDILRANAWVPFVVTIVGTNAEADIAVLALQEQLVGANLNIEIDSAGCAAGQEVFFLGYPLGIRGPEVQPGFPLPLIKRGIASNFYRGPPDGIFVSASANPGFSGGPVYFAHHQTGRATLTAIVVQSLAYEVSVKNAQGKEVGMALTDSNIAQCHYIKYALELIDANKIGFPLDHAQRA